MKLMLRALVGHARVATTGVARAGDPLLTMLDPYFRIQTVAQRRQDRGREGRRGGDCHRRQGDGRAGAPIAKAADALAGATDLGAARTAFGQLSDAVIAFSESTKAEAATTCTPCIARW